MKVSSKQLMVRIQADEARDKIYEMLKQQPMTTPNIAKALNITKQACHHHMKVLRSGGYTYLERTYHQSMVNKVIDPSVEYKMKYTRDLLTNREDSVEIDKQAERNPHIRVVKNLNRPGSDYAWQRRKNKPVNPWRASSFAKFDSF